MTSPPFETRALFEYKSSYEDDLSFGVGQLITVDAVEDEEWYSGSYVDLDGVTQSGMFPRNFVEVIVSHPPVPHRPSKQEVEERAPMPSPIKEEPVVAPSTPVAAAAAAAPASAASPTGGFRDKISAFNAGNKAPMPFSKPQEQSYVKKQFAASSQSSYVPPSFGHSETHHTHSQQPAGPAATPVDVVKEADAVEEEEGPKMSLKERIALLQKTQQDEAERESASLKKKQEKKTKKKATPLQSDHTGSKSIEEEDVADNESILSSRSRHSIHVHHTGIDSVAEDHEPVDEETEERQDHDESVLVAPEGQVEPETAEEGENEEDEEEDEEDAEETRRRNLRERMAKISGGMGMFGMMGSNPFGGAPPAKAKKPKEDVEPEEEDIPRAIPILPFTAPKLPVALSKGGEEADEEDNTKDSETVDEEENEEDVLVSTKAPPPPIPVPVPSISTENLADKTMTDPSTSMSVPIETSSLKEEDSTSEDVDDAEEDEVSDPVSKNIQTRSAAPPIPHEMALSSEEEPTASLNKSGEKSLRLEPVEPVMTGYEADEDSDIKRSETSAIPPPIPHSTRPPPPPIPTLPPAPPVSQRPSAPIPPPIPGSAPPIPGSAPPIQSINRSFTAPETVNEEFVEVDNRTYDSSDDEDYDDVSTAIADYSDLPNRSSISRRSFTLPEMAPPPPPPVVPPIPRETNRSSMDFTRPLRADVSGNSFTQGRLSMDHSGNSIGPGHLTRSLTGSERANQTIAQGVVDLEPGSSWWLRSELPPSLMNGAGVDLTYEVDTHQVKKRGGKTVVLRDFYVLYQDYSQTVIEVNYETTDPQSTVVFRQFHKPAPIARKDLLARYSNIYGDKIVSNASRYLGTKVGEEFVSFVLGKIPEILPSIGSKVFGATVYKNANNQTIQRYDDFKPGDILCIKKGRFEGHTKLHQKVRKEVGFGENPLSTILLEFDHTKKKFRVLEQDSTGIIKKESYKLSEMKSGRIRVFRATGRDYVEW